MKRNCHEEDLFDVRTLKIFQPDDAPFLLGYLHTLVLSAARGDLSPFEHPSSLHLLTDVVLQSAHNGDPTGFVRAVAKSTPGPILIRVLTKTLLIRRSFTACGSRDIGDINLPVRRCAIEAFISSSIVILITLFDDPGVVADVLETGLLSSLLKRPSCLVNLPINIEQNLGSLFDVINQSMVFSAVFRAFVRAQKRGGSRYARHINNAPSSLVEKWESLEEKMCSDRVYEHSRSPLQTLRSVWHHLLLTSLSKEGLEGRTSSSVFFLSNRAIDDIFFLPRVSEAYLADNALEIQVMIDSYVDSLPRGEDDNLGTLDPAYLDPAYLSDFRLVRTGEKNPIMIHNLTLPGIPAPSRCMRPVFTASAATIPMNDCDCSGLLTAWRRFSNRLFVVVIPPNIKRRKSAFYVNIPWPPRRE
ncbi:hypothetical protein PQX77_008648 [Marasmius sp. AFHP31]|nr:hypothetical protein PQX77_008648 [Marasmius sp. AFHP31]